MDPIPSKPDDVTLPVPPTPATPSTAPQVGAMTSVPLEDTPLAPPAPVPLGQLSPELFRSAALSLKDEDPAVDDPLLAADDAFIDLFEQDDALPLQDDAQLIDGGSLGLDAAQTHILDTLAKNYIMTSDRAYAVINGTLYVSDRDKGNWRKTEHTDVQQLRYGTNQGVYILKGNNELLRIGNGTPDSPPIKLPENESISDFAVSVTGKIAVLSTEKKTKVGLVTTPADMADGPATIDWVQGPPDVDIASIVYKANGELMLADTSGQIHMRGHDGQWTAAPAVPEHVGTPSRLLVLRGGTPAALNEQGKLYALVPGKNPDRDDSQWMEATHATPPSVVEFFGQFKSRMDPAQMSKFVLGFPAGPARDNLRSEGKSSFLSKITPPVFKRDYDDQSRLTRLADWASAHSSSILSAKERSPFAWDKEDYLNEGRQTVGKLQDFVAAPFETVGGIELQPMVTREKPELLQLARMVAGNANTVLDKLEHQLGSNKADFQNSRFYAQVHAPDKANTPDNALYLLQQAYRRGRLGDDHRAVSDRIDRMLGQGIFLGVSRTAKSGDPKELKNLWGKGLENDWGVWTDKLLHDAELLTKNAADFHADQRPLEYVDGDGGESGDFPNRVTFMYKKGFHSTARVEKFFDEVATFSGAMKRHNHSFQRAMSAQGLLTRETKTQAENGQDPATRKAERNYAFLKHLQGMEVGQEVQMSAAEYYGLDMEGFSLFAKVFPDLKVEEHGAFQTWGIEPLLSIGPRTEHTITWTRTTDGFDVSFGREYTRQGLVGFKTQHGIGGNVNDGKTNLLFGYAGLNGKVQPLTASYQVKDTFAVSLKFDELGTMEERLKNILAGNVSAYDLASMTTGGVANSHQTTWSAGPKLDIEPLVASGWLIGTSKVPFDERFKVIGAPAVEQFNFKLSAAKTVEDAVDGKGNISMSENATGWAATIDWTHIHVLEGQFGLTGFKQAFEAQFKIPFQIEVYAKALYRNLVAPHGSATEIRDEQTQLLKTIESTATFSNVPANRAASSLPDRVNTDYGKVPYNADFNETNAPELTALKNNPELWEQILQMKKDNLPLSVTRELKPDLLDAIKKMPSTTEEDVTARNAHIRELRDNPDNWRITKISTSDKMGYDTSANLGFVFVRMFSSASSNLTPTPKVMTISYDQDNRSSFTTSGMYANHEKFTGEKNMSELQGLRALLKNEQMLERLQNPLTAADPLGQAALRASYAPFINDVLSKLESQNVFHKNGLGPIEEQVLKTFFPPIKGSDPYNKECVDFIVSNRQVLEQFKAAVRTAGHLTLREPIAQHDPATLTSTLQAPIKSLLSLPGSSTSGGPLQEFLRDPTRGHLAGSAEQRMTYLPYIIRVLDHPEPSDDPFRKACLDAYFPPGTGAAPLAHIRQNPEARAQFDQSIQRAFQQFDSDKKDIHDFLAKLKTDPERLQAASDLANCLEGKSRGLGTTLEERKQIGKVFPWIDSTKAQATADAISLPEANTSKLSEMIVSDPVRLKLFNEGVAQIMRDQPQRSLTESSEHVRDSPTVAARVPLPASLSSRSTTRSDTQKAASGSGKLVPRTETFEDVPLQVIATASAPAVVSGEAPPRSQSPTVSVKTQSVHSTGRR